MTIQDQIGNYIASQPQPKQGDLLLLHNTILKIKPKCRLWFLDGKNEQGRTVSNPNIGYGQQTMKLAGGNSREFYQIGLSANTTGISVYILGIEDKKYLANTYGKKLGKATVTGYCIKFKALADVNLNVLVDAITYGLENLH